jgi:hypothetical protein
MTQTNQVNGSPPPLTVVEPGEGEVTGDIGGIGIAFKLRGTRHQRDGLRG